MRTENELKVELEAYLKKNKFITIEGKQYEFGDYTPLEVECIKSGFDSGCSSSNETKVYVILKPVNSGEAIILSLSELISLLQQQSLGLL